MSTYTTHFAPAEPKHHVCVRRSSYAKRKKELSFLSLLLHAKNTKIAELLLVIETKDAKIKTKIKTKNAILVLYKKRIRGLSAEIRGLSAEHEKEIRGLSAEHEKEIRGLNSVHDHDNYLRGQMRDRIELKNDTIKEQQTMIDRLKDTINRQTNG